jgi:hypothetical protein
LGSGSRQNAFRFVAVAAAEGLLLITVLFPTRVLHARPINLAVAKLQGWMLKPAIPEHLPRGTSTSIVSLMTTEKQRAVDYSSWAFELNYLLASGLFHLGDGGNNAK